MVWSLSGVEGTAQYYVPSTPLRDRNRKDYAFRHFPGFISISLSSPPVDDLNSQNYLDWF